MVHTVPKLFRALCSMAVMLALVAGITAVPALAASNGIYIATATPHYKHPVTGAIEDSGGENSAVLGQSMTESVTDKKALVEVDENGATYVTVRLKLMDNIQNPKFQVDGSAVSATLMQEDYSANTADYRIKVKSESSIIRCSMYVIPMSRDVIFYITLSGLQSGSGDFIPSITVKTPEPSTPSSQTSSSQTPAAQTSSSQPPSSSSSQASSPSSSAPSSNSDSSSPSSSRDVPSSEAPSSQASSSSSTLGLTEFDASGNAVHSEPSLNAGTDGSAAFWWVLGGIVVLVAAGGCVWYFCFFKKGKRPFQKH